MTTPRRNPFRLDTPPPPPEVVVEGGPTTLFSSSSKRRHTKRISTSPSPGNSARRQTESHTPHHHTKGNRVESTLIPGRTYYGGVYFAPRPTMVLDRQLTRLHQELVSPRQQGEGQQQSLQPTAAAGLRTYSVARQANRHDEVAAVTFPEPMPELAAPSAMYNS